MFRNLRIERPGNWKIRIIVLRMSDERNGAGIGLENGLGRADLNAEGAVVGVELVSSVISVEEGAASNENICEYFLIFFEFSLCFRWLPLMVLYKRSWSCLRLC